MFQAKYSEFYIDKRNAETLIIKERTAETVMLLNPNTWIGSKYTLAEFDWFLTKKKITKARYVLDYGIKEYSAAAIDIFYEGAMDLKSLHAAIPKIIQMHQTCIKSCFIRDLDENKILFSNSKLPALHEQLKSFLETQNSLTPSSRPAGSRRKFTAGKNRFQPNTHADQ